MFDPLMSRHPSKRRAPRRHITSRYNRRLRDAPTGLSQARSMLRRKMCSSEENHSWISEPRADFGELRGVS